MECQGLSIVLIIYTYFCIYMHKNCQKRNVYKYKIKKLDQRFILELYLGCWWRMADDRSHKRIFVFDNIFVHLHANTLEANNLCKNVGNAMWKIIFLLLWRRKKNVNNVHAEIVSDWDLFYCLIKIYFYAVLVWLEKFRFHPWYFNNFLRPALKAPWKLSVSYFWFKNVQK